MDLVKYVKDKQLKGKLSKIKPGNIVAVHQKIREGSKERVQVFKGIVIRVKSGYGVNGSFTVRKIASGVGVEKTFLFNSPLVEKVEVIKQAKVRRAKLYYLRGRFGKSARLNLSGDDKGVESLVREVVGEDDNEKDASIINQDSSRSQNDRDGEDEVKSDKNIENISKVSEKKEEKVIKDKEKDESKKEKKKEVAKEEKAEKKKDDKKEEKPKKEDK